MPSDRDGAGRRRPAGHSHRLQLNRHTRGMSLSVPIEMQPLFMKCSLLAARSVLELGTPTVARLGQPTEVAGEWRPPLPSTPTRCSGCRGPFPSRAPKEGSQRGAATTLCTWRRSCAPAAAQPSRKSQPSSPDANPVQEVAGTVIRHGWVPLGPTERPPGARQPCFWALFQRSRANYSRNEPVYILIHTVISISTIQL